MARDGLLSDLKSTGLPTRRVEAWHYTDLKALLRAVPAVDPSAVAKPVAPLVEQSTVFAVLNGKADDAGAPDGVTLRRYAELLADGTASAGLAARGSDDAISRINGVFVRDGLAIEVAADAVIEAPIEIQAVQNAGQAHTRFPVRFGENSKATLIERHIAAGDQPALVTSVSDVVLADGAEITWIIFQSQGIADTHLGQIKVSLGTGARLRLYVINVGGKLVRQEIHVTVAGEDSDLTLRGHKPSGRRDPYRRDLHGRA